MLSAGCRQHRGCIIPQAVIHSLVLLKMGKIIARNMLRWLELLINRYCWISLVVYYLYQWCTVKEISNNEIYLLIKYIKSVLWRAPKLLSYIEDARCLKVNVFFSCFPTNFLYYFLFVIVHRFWVTLR